MSVYLENYVKYILVLWFWLELTMKDAKFEPTFLLNIKWVYLDA